MNNEIQRSKAEIEIAETCNDKPAQDYSETSFVFDKTTASDVKSLIVRKVSEFRLKLLGEPKNLYIGGYYLMILKRDGCVSISGAESMTAFGLNVFVLNCDKHIGVGI
jgi:hypothetical protein